MITKFLTANLTDKQKELIKWNSDTTKAMLTALDHSILSQSYSLSLPAWADRDPVLVKEFTWLMAQLSYGTSTVKRNYAEFKFNIGVVATNEEITAYRKQAKLDRCLLRLDTKVYPNNLVKRNGKIHNDGLARPAMMRTSKNQFQIDTVTLDKYRRPIKVNLVKSIKKMVEKKQIKKTFFKDEASYLEIADLCLDHYINNPQEKYNSEANIQDQRGRAIKKVLKRVGNYISSKDFRALLKVPISEGAYMLKQDDKESLDSIFYFIAELTGHKCLGLTESIKMMAGKRAYLARELPRLDLKSKEGLDELHVLIWLERCYEKLDKLYSRGYTLWDIPVEIDSSMSLGQIVGALTNDKRILESTCLLGNILSDPWNIKGVKRLTAKSIGTPVLTTP